MSTVAFVGLGNMGGPMAANLVKAGFTVRGFDLVPELVADAARHGVVACSSVAEACEGADAVVTMLPKGDHVREAYTGDGGILGAAPTSALLIDSSTIDIATCQDMHDAAAAAGYRFVDAPVSGGISGASAATLTFMVGGAADAVADAKTFIEPMAGNIFETGGPTTGEAAKIVNNMMLFISIQAASEGSVLARRLGLDDKVFHDIISVSSGNSWAVQTWYPVPDVIDTAAANSEFAATFRTDLAHKDMGLALAGAADHDLDLPAAKLVQERFQAAMDAGAADLDCTLIVASVDPDAPGVPAEYDPTTSGGRS